MTNNLSDFSDFMSATDQTVLSGVGELINEAVERKYFLRQVMRGKPNTEVIQGGKTITDHIMFEDYSTYDQVGINQTFVWSNPQFLDNWSVPWRYGMDHMSWTDQEIELQVPAGVTRSSRARIYKDLKAAKERRFLTSLINGLENELWDFPVATQMEAANGKKPYSIPAHINEQTNGLYAGWTTKQGLDPAVQPKWAPQKFTYNYATVPNITEPESNPPLITAFDDAYLSLGYDELPMYGSQSEARSNASMIVASKFGVNYYKAMLRMGNDTHIKSKSDPGVPGPAYEDIPVVYASKLDTAALWATASGFTNDADTATTADGPRYFWLNRKYFRPFFHARRYMYKHPVRVHPNQPSTHVQVVDCWHNYPVNSLQRHGLVTPAA